MRVGVIALVLLLGASTAEAQIVNVQSLIGDTKEGVSGSVDAAVDWRTGNVALLLLSGAATVRYRADKNLVFAIVRGDYGLFGDTDTEIIKKTFGHVRYRRTLHKRVIAEAFVQGEADQFRRILVRALAGAGPRFVILDRKQVGVVYGVAYMFEYEQLRDDMEDDAGTEAKNHRLSTYLLGTLALNDHLKISETIYLQPRVDDPGDFRLLNEFSLTSKISTHLAIKTALVVAYDSTPPDAIKNTDTTLQTGLSLSF